MEKLYIRCPYCGKLTHITNEQERQTGRCPGCWRDIPIPSWEKLLSSAAGATFQTPFIEGTPIRMISQTAEALDGHPNESLPLEILPSLDLKPLRVGQIIQGRYKLLSLNESTTSEAKIQHLEWGVPLTIKAQHLHWPEDKEQSLETLLRILEKNKKDFLQQIEKAGDLGKHPNIVTVYFGISIDNIPWLFQEFVEASTLQSWIDGGKISELKTALDLAIQLCRGMAFLHKHGTAHLNLKPDSVWVGKKGTLQVGNFCPSKDSAVPASPDLENLLYVAPESWRMSSQVGASADIYMFGIILYQMLCRENIPWKKRENDQRSNLEIYRDWHLREKPNNPSEYCKDIPSNLSELILKCLSKEVGDRPKNFDDINKDLLEIYEKVVGGAYKREIPDEKALTSLNLNNRALCKIEIDKYEDAEKLLEQTITSDPKFFPAHLNINVLRLREGKIDLSTFLTRTSELVNIDESKSVLYRGMVCLEKGGFLREAFSELKRIQARMPEDRDLLRLEGDILFRMRDFHGACPIFERLVQDEEADGGDWYRLGAAYLETGDHNNARNAWRMGLEMEPDHPELQIGLGMLLGIDGKKEEAMQSFSNVLEQNPINISALLNLAEINAGSGIYTGTRDSSEKEKAKKLYERLFELGGWSPRSVRGYLACGGGSTVPNSLPHIGYCFIWSYLNNLNGSKCVAITRDGKYIATTLEDKTVRLLEISTYKEKAVYEGHQKDILALSFTPDGKFLVSGGEDRNLKIWDVESGKEIKILSGHTGKITSIVVTSDGKTIISGSGDEMIRTWSIEEGSQKKILSAHMDHVTSLAMAPDGKHLISGSLDKTVKIWDIETGKLLNSLEGHKEGVCSLSITRDGKYIISGSLDKTVKVWDIETGKLLNSLEGHNKKVTALVISPKDNIVFSGSEDKTIRIWDLKSGKCVGILEGHGEGIEALEITPDGLTLISASSRELYLWENIHERPCPCLWKTPYIFQEIKVAFENLKIRRQIESLERQARAFLVKGKVTEAIQKYRQIQSTPGYENDPEAQRGVLRATYLGGYRRKGLRRTRPLKIFQQSDWVEALSLSPDGMYALTGSWDNKVRFWDLKNVVQTEEGSPHELWSIYLTPVKGVHNEVWALTISPDGRLALTGSGDKLIRVWDIKNGRCLGFLEGHEKEVTALAVSPNGKMAISGSADNTLRVWNLRTMRHIITLEGHEGKIKALAMSPDSITCVSASTDKTLRIWDIESGVSLGILEGHRDHVECVDINSEGRIVVSGSRDKTLKIWDIEKVEEISTLEGHTEKVTTVALTRDGRFAISGSADNTLRIWNLKGYCLALLQGHTHMVTCISITPDNQYALSGSRDKTLRVWELDWEVESPAPDETQPNPYPKDLYRKLLDTRKEYETSENWSGALETCERMISLAPENAKLHHNRGRLLTQLQRYSEARDSFRKALFLDPSLDVAKRALEKLEK